MFRKSEFLAADNGLAPGGGGVHSMLRVRVCAAHMGGFLSRNSLNKGPFFGRFSINMGGFSRNWRKIAKNGLFPPKFIIKVGMKASSRN